MGRSCTKIRVYLAGNFSKLNSLSQNVKVLQVCAGNSRFVAIASWYHKFVANRVRWLGLFLKKSCYFLSTCSSPWMLKAIFEKCLLFLWNKCFGCLSVGDNSIYFAIEKKKAEKKKAATSRTLSATLCEYILPRRRSASSFYEHLPYVLRAGHSDII